MLWRPRSDRVKKYKQIRMIGRELASQMLDVVPEEVLTRAARDMNIIHKTTFVFDSEEELSILQDRMIYDILWDGKNVIKHFEEEKGSDLSEAEKKVLEAMKGAYFSLFEVIGNASRESLHLSDLLSGGQIELTDISLSKTAPKGSLLATRIVKVQDICMTSGVAYPFLPEHKDILISGIKKGQPAQRSRKKRSVGRIDFSEPRNYSLYFFRQYKRLSPVEIRMSDEVFE